MALVCAPAGYGKTTLVCAWLQHTKGYRAWLSLDEADNDVTEFLTYCLASIRHTLPDFATDLFNALLSTGSLSNKSFLSGLNAALEGVDQDITLVLDEFQVIHSPEVLDLITQFMHRPHPSLHLMLLTRHDPYLPLGTWRVRNQLIDIRPSGLRFDFEETADFLGNAAAATLSREDVAQLQTRTEGWGAALRLVKLSLLLRDGVQIDSLNSLIGTHDIMDYLATQVLNDLSPEKQLFLLQTSILDRLSPSVCEAVIGDQIEGFDAKVMLDELTADNLFLMPLGLERRWYRYHYLFKEFLRMRLARQHSAEAIASLHQRASRWSTTNGYIIDAIRYALAAGDMELAVQLVADNRQELMIEDRWRQLESWYRQFPESMVERSPDLLLITAWNAQFRRFDLAEVQRLTETIDRLLDDPELEPHHTAELAAENGVLKAIPNYFSVNPEAALAACNRALEVLPLSHYVARNYAWLFRAASSQMRGDMATAYDSIERSRHEELQIIGSRRARAAAAEAFVSWMAADLAGVSRAGQAMLSSGSMRKQPQTLVWGHYFKACAHYELNQLDHALEHAQFSFDNRHAHHSHGAVQAGMIAALVQLARGRDDKVDELMADMSDYLLQVHSEPLIAQSLAMQAEIATRRGRVHEAFHWIEQAYHKIPLVAMPHFFISAMTIPKVMLALNDPAYNDRLGDCLSRLHQHTERIHNTRRLIDVLAMEALYYDSLGNEQAALAALECSLRLAEPSGFIRAYVDFGPRMRQLLDRLPGSGPSARYLDQVRTAFQPVTDRTPANSLIEPLTNREREVIILLGRRLSNKEIAQRLFITESTVKRHTINIYQKMGVSGRRAAVEAAVELGILDQDDAPIG